jgi:hypothetical protein
MMLSTLVRLVVYMSLLPFTTAASKWKFSKEDIDSGKAISILNRQALVTAYGLVGSSPSCTKDKVRVRKEW